MAAALERLASQRRRSSFTQQQTLENEVRRHRKTAIDTFTNPAFDDGQAPAHAEGPQQHSVPLRRSSTATRQQTVQSKQQRQADAAVSKPEPQGLAQRPPQARFQGDVSTWGNDGGGSDGEGSAASLSSGLSPRDGDAAPARAWDLETGKQVLAAEAEQYGRSAAAMERHGTVGDARGADLPSRLAAQQMGALAGMSLKVQEALLHSQRMFQQRVAHQERALLHAALSAWLQLRDAAQAKERCALRAIRRMRRRRLSRTFGAWRLRVVDPDRRSCLLKQARAALGRRLMQRALLSWGAVVETRCAAAHLAMRDHEICTLNKEIRKWEAGAVHAAAQRRLRRWLHAWAAWQRHQARKRATMQQAAKHWRHTAQRSATRTWQEHAGRRRQRRARVAAAAAKLRRSRLQRLLRAWAAAPATKRRHLRLVDAAVARGSRKRNLMQAWAGWRWFADRQRQRRVAAVRPLAQVWRGWVAVAAHCRHVRVGIETCRQRSLHRLLGEALDDWADASADAKAARQFALIADLQQRLAAAQAESSRLAADNARYTRLIDNPDWDPQVQAAERTAHAEEVAALTAERDALRQAAEAASSEAAVAKAEAVSNYRLLPPRRRTTADAAARSAAALARLTASRRNTQQDGYGDIPTAAPSTAPASPVAAGRPAAKAARRPLASRANNGLLPHNRGLPQLLAGPEGLAGFDPAMANGRHWRPPSPTGGRASPGRRPLSARSPADMRNRLLVQGGSDFNALVKALRRHADEEGHSPGSPPRKRGATSPKKFDKLSMDMVEVHPDGSLRVEALPAHRHPHANRFTTKSAAAHVAFGVTSPARPSSPSRRPASTNGKASNAASGKPPPPTAMQNNTRPGNRPEGPQRMRDDATTDHEGEYDVTVTSTPAAPIALGQQDQAAAEADVVDDPGA